MIEVDKTPVIIGISGFKGSGKTTFGRDLARRIGMRVMHLADPIKQITANIDPYDSKGVLLSTSLEIGGDTYAKEKHDKYRHTLRAVGEGIRKVDPEFWFDKLLAESYGMKGIVVPDIRFSHEAARCDVVIHVIRPGVESDGDETEQDLRHFANIIVNNDGTKAELVDKAKQIVADFEMKGADVY